MLFSGILTLSATIEPAMPITAASQVNLALVSAAQTVATGETFDIVIQAQSESQEVVGIDTYLDFDPTKLAVIDMNSGKTGIQISGGTTLSIPLWNAANNTTGHIDYSAGAFNPYPKGTFTIASIRFLALAATSPTTTVSFSNSFDRPTMVIGDTRAANMTGTLTGGTYMIRSENAPAPTGGSSSVIVGDSRKTLNTSGFSTTTALIINNDGVAQNSVLLITTDGQAVLNIAAGTTLLNSSGNPSSILTAETLTMFPPIPANNSFISGYNFGPSGTTFNPPIVLSLSYDQTVLPEGVVESNLYIAYYDGIFWVELESTVDPVTKTVTANISRFYTFALMCKISADATSSPLDPVPDNTTVLKETKTTPEATATIQISTISETPIEDVRPEPTPAKEEPPARSDKYVLVVLIMVAIVILTFTSLILIRRNNVKNKP